MGWNVVIGYSTQACVCVRAIVKEGKQRSQRDREREWEGRTNKINDDAVKSKNGEGKRLSIVVFDPISGRKGTREIPSE